ncbi:hypothetical protein D9M72_323890 [compost metagenome]
MFNNGFGRQAMDSTEEQVQVVAMKASHASTYLTFGPPSRGGTASSSGHARLFEQTGTVALSHDDPRSRR